MGAMAGDDPAFREGPALDLPVTPTEPAQPTPQTFAEAETHAPPGEPMAIVRENQPAPQEAAAPADAPKEAKAS